MAKKKKKSRLKRLVLLFGVLAVGSVGFLILLLFRQNVPLFDKTTYTIIEDFQQLAGGVAINEDYIEIYQRAALAYDMDWTLLAAVHRIETRFSTMQKLVSPVGAEGHMQFMPCTFVGWNHPSCGGLGQGDIPEHEKTDPAVIAKYGGYGVDANGDGIADPFDIEDAIYSAANYLSRSGASSGDIKKALFNYNRSEQYVADVYHFYEQFEKIRDQFDVVKK